MNNLIMKLIEQMDLPMIKYVNIFKVEITTIKCHHVLVALENMRQVPRDRRVKLTQVGKRD